MDANDLKNIILDFQENDGSNRIAEGFAKDPKYIGRKIFDGVLIGVASADDEIIASLSANEEANIDMIQPKEWLPGAKSVVSVFMPFAKWITEENAGGDWPSDGWLHGRIEGQAAIEKAATALAEALRSGGEEAIVPIHDPRFQAFAPVLGKYEPVFSSNWSERHVAYAAGLGTFSISRGLITEMGIAGRFTSVITTLPLTPKQRNYTELYEYCNKCGLCTSACPAGAISIEKLKDHNLCSPRISIVKQKETPYYGCGKCQCGMPCSFGIPV